MLKIRPVNNYKITKKEKRNAGVDFCRILGMIDIIIYHIVTCKYLQNKYQKYFKNLKLIEILTQWHISNFGIISGIIGFKTNKYSNLLYLYLCVLFYSLTIHYLIKKYYKNKFYYYSSSIGLPKDYYYPLIRGDYWYFSTYFGMYLFLPLINKGLSLVDKAELRIIILSLFGILFIWKDIMSKEPLKFCSDTSFTTLSIYFILGSYIGKYILNRKNNKSIFYYLYYLFWMMIFLSSSYFTYYLMLYEGSNELKLLFKKILYCRSNSIAMVFQSTSIILIFLKIKYNKKIAKIISFFGPLSFSAYLIHNHQDIRSILFPTIFRNISSNLSFQYLIFLFITKGILVFFACMIIDYLRNLLFTILRIRQICIFIEKIIFSISRKITGDEEKYLEI
jgi:surface polysaccharide O-acyltransferase-like enzyme